MTEQIHKGYARSHGAGTKTLKTFWLRDLGSQYKVEKTEDWDYCEGNEKSYGEMIRVRGSRPEPPYFLVPSRLYKYSETKSGLYLKERKNLWCPLGRILNQRIDIHDAELVIHFPISRFNEVAEIVPFVRKRGSGVQSESFKEARRLTQFRAKNGDKSGQNDPNLKDSEPSNAITRLDSFDGEKLP